MKRRRGPGNLRGGGGVCWRGCCMGAPVSGPACGGEAVGEWCNTCGAELRGSYLCPAGHRLFMFAFCALEEY